MMEGIVSQKLYRAGEAANLLIRYAADLASRKTMLDCYASLSRPELHSEEVELRLKVKGRTFHFQMRRSDLFTLGEILHEGQYRLQSSIPSSPVIVDAGANVGVSGIWFLGLFPDATLHVFEPAADNFRILKTNLGSLQGVKLFQAAVGIKSGTASLHLAGHAAMHSLVDSEASGESETVPVVCLAEHMQSQGIKRIDLLKLDVEGSDLDALLGLGDRIRDVGVIIGEMHEAQVNPTEFYTFLEQNGFRICWKRYFRGGREQRVHGFEAVRQSSNSR